MGSSFVKLKGRGFWSRDGNLEDWLRAQVEILDSSPGLAPWLQDLREHWRVQATGGFNGSIDTRLNETIGTDESRQAALLQIAETARQRIEGGQCAVVDASVRDFVLGLADSWVKLLKEEIATDLSDRREIPKRPPGS